MLLLVLMACSDVSVVAKTPHLKAEIESPADGTEVGEGASVTFSGTASDENEVYGRGELEVTWTEADPDHPDDTHVVCETAPASSDGGTACTFVPAERLICLTVAVPETDPVTATACRTLTLVPSGSPEVTVEEPLASGVYYSDQIVTLAATVSDPEDAPEAIVLTWTSTLDGPLGDGGTPDSAGLGRAFFYLTEGEHALTVEATDTDGHTGTDSVIVDIGPPNTPPGCGITSPADGTAGDIGATIDFRASVSDPDIPEDWIAVTWSSDRDGVLGTSSPDSGGDVAFPFAGLSAGTHVISLSAADEVGATCSDFILTTVGSPPTVSVLAPVDGTDVTVGDTVRFEALVSDAEDRPEDLVVEWASDRDGVLSTAPPDSTGSVVFSAADLSIGSHGITVVVTDPDGLYSREFLTLQVSDCPDRWYADADGDGFGDPSASTTGCAAPSGYVADATDCDDADAEIRPGTDEYCNGVDDDCDGTTDEATAIDTLEWYADTDGDLYGDATASAWSCDLPVGYVADDTDCDDGLAAANPGATEVCDTIDNDCDGTVDEASAADADTWYADADADGYGDASVSTRACTSPTGYGADATDCDDTAASVHPGAAEVTADGVDEDCDGSEACQQDADRDAYGSTTLLASADLDCADAGESALASDCDDGAAAVNPGATEACDGIDNDCDGLTDESGATGETTWYADADADTYGSETVSARSCTVPSGYVSNNSDCDDGSAAVSPAASETTADGVDGDCDDVEVCYRDADRDTYGTTTTTTSTADLDCADAGESSVSTDCDDSSAAIHPGATETTADGIDQDCSGSDDCYTDADRDGYGSTTTVASVDTDCTDAGESSVSTDCDDTTSAVSPADTEVCDGIDNDCDGTTDETSASGATTWYRDADSDGYGASSTTSTACTAPSGYVASSTDCDDARSGVNPAATETCATTYDDDCDSVTNEAGATACTTYYTDADGDGYGDTPSSCLCTATSTYSSALGTDCDDGDANANPGQSEVCDSSNTDEDCDGTADDSDSSATGETSWYRDADSDGYGTATTSLSRCDRPSGYVADDDDCDDTDSTVSPSDTEVCADGEDDDCDGDVDEGCGWYGEYDVNDSTEYYALIYGEDASDYFGYDLDGPSDFDGDGTADLVTVANGDDYGGSGYGTVYIHDGPLTAGDQEADDHDDARRYGNSGSFGLTEAHTVPDIDGDGDDELYIRRSDSTGYLLRGNVSSTASWSSSSYASPSCDEVAGAGDWTSTSGNDEWVCGYSYYNSNAGVVYVYNGSSVYATLTGESASDQAGLSVAGGPGNDVDGDGYDDIWIGAYGDDDNGADAGAVYLVQGPVSGSMSLASADQKILGAAAGDDLGMQVVAAGDMDGDGEEDLLAAAPYDDDGGTSSGVVFLFTDPTRDDRTTDASANIRGDDASDYLGLYGVSTGDVNGDGDLDVLVCTPNNDDSASNAGSTWLIYGPLSGTHDLGSTSGYDAQFSGDSASDYSGTDCAILGDTDGDGNDDFAIAGWGYDDGSTTSAGAVWIFLGE